MADSATWRGADGEAFSDLLSVRAFCAAAVWALTRYHSRFSCFSTTAMRRRRS